MSEQIVPIPRSKMTQRERLFRSQLAQIIHGAGVLRGNLSIRQRTCGKPNCKCAKGERHVSLYLVFRQDGKFHQLFVPKSLEQEVRLWVLNHQKARNLLEEISRIYREKIEKRES